MLRPTLARLWWRAGLTNSGTRLDGDSFSGSVPVEYDGIQPTQYQELDLGPSRVAFAGLLMADFLAPATVEEWQAAGERPFPTFHIQVFSSRLRDLYSRNLSLEKTRGVSFAWPTSM